MLKSLKGAHATKINRGAFKININMPGRAFKNPADPNGFLQLGRFDRAQLQPAVFIGMHPHENDEILSYLRTGEMIHEDNLGERVSITNTNLMMMNAGKHIQHQEFAPSDSDDVHMLQIFLRPEVADQEPIVQFHDFKEAYSMNKWRLIAGPEESGAPLKIRTKASVKDVRLEAGQTLGLPLATDKTYYLYIFDGQISIGDHIYEAQDAVIYAEELIEVKAEVESDLVLFELDQHAEYTLKGMFSGAGAHTLHS